MALPFLPGNQFNPKLGSEKFHKSHCFDYNNQVPGYVGFDKSGIGGDLLPGRAPPPSFSKFPTGKGSAQPSWVAFDRQVLCFFSFCQEPVHEKREERSRLRKVNIYFYLEDDTIQVVEMKQQDSGMLQGTMVRRHRVPRPKPLDGSYFTVDDFSVGGEVQIYSKTFKIVSCDQFTRNFLTKMGKTVPEDGKFPGDDYTTHRETIRASMQSLRPYEKFDTLKQYLDNDRKVLRFYSVWDDTNNMFGEVREMVLHYFLADDTVEIVELYKPNCQRDTIPVFLHRVRLPKSAHTVPQPGQTVNRTILNVFGPMGKGGRHILDNLRTGAEPVEYYHHSDLGVGRHINVHGRRLLMCDADGFTRNFYGMTDDEEPIEYRRDKLPVAPRPIPPHSDLSIGLQEDAIENCKNLVPKVPKKDFIKFYVKDRHGLESHVLRFLAKIQTDLPIDKDRRFVISVFLSDDTVGIFEPPQRNSGVIGGQFLARARVVNPKAGIDPDTHHTRFYKPEDFAVGRTLTFNKHAFILIDADDYVYQYMEQNSHEFPQSSLTSIMATLRSVSIERQDEFTSSFKEAEGLSTGPGTMGYLDFVGILLGLVSEHLISHEVNTIARCYVQQSSTVPEITKIVSTAQEQLKKVNFESFARLLDLLRYEDEEGSGHLPREVMRRVCVSSKVPLTREVLSALLDMCPRNEWNNVSYEKFVGALNWRQNPMHAGGNEAATIQHTIAAFSFPQSMPAAPEERLVNCERFLEDLFGK